jgi:hypothetical protein
MAHRTGRKTLVRWLRSLQAKGRAALPKRAVMGDVAGLNCRTTKGNYQNYFLAQTSKWAKCGNQQPPASTIALPSPMVELTTISLILV